MALVYVDRVWDITATTGTGTYTCNNTPPTGYQGMTAGLATDDETYYMVTDGTDWEVGRGTFNETGDTVTRDTILDSSNSGLAVNWGAGDKDIMTVIPAFRFGQLDNFQVDAQANLGATEASGLDSIAIGDNARAYEGATIAIGETAQAGQTAGGSSEQDAIAIGRDTFSYEAFNIALGHGCVAGQTPAASANNAISIGTDCLASASAAVAIGNIAFCYGASGLAIGPGAVCKELYGVSIGPNAVTGQTNGGTTESNAIAIGDADAFEGGCISIGDGAKAGDETTSNSPFCIAIGASATAGNNNNVAPAEPYAIAIGQGATAYEQSCISIGWGSTSGNSTAPGYYNAIAIGAGPIASAVHAIGIGSQVTNYGPYAVAIGYDADARELHCVALGDCQAGQANTGANGNYAVSIGYSSRASETSCVAIGNGALCGGTSGTNYPNGISIGASASVTGQQSTAIGYQATAAGVHYAVSIGPGCDVEGDYSIAMGNLTEVRERYSIGIGYSVRTGQLTDGTTHPNIIAIGYDNNAYEGYGICLGSSNTIGTTSGSSNQYNTILGHNCNISGSRAEAVAIGRGITITRNGEWLKGVVSSDIDFKRGECGWAVTTSDATPTKMLINGAYDNYWDMGTYTAIAFSLLVVGYGTNGTFHGMYKIEGAIHRLTGDPILSSTTTVLALNGSTMDCVVGVDTVNDGLYIEVTGQSTASVKWVADMRFAEIEY